ncbi:MAG: hypothetical protein HOV80_04245 [Polyangiaceae bacterium]|nr:hypothetical protein [Polyangiaceae bacterium]
MTRASAPASSTSTAARAASSAVAVVSAAASAFPGLPPTASATSILVGEGGGGRSLLCIGLTTDKGPPPCPSAAFCHRLSLADLSIGVASISSKAAPAPEKIIEHYNFVSRGPFGNTETDQLLGCFRGEPPDRPLRATVRVELSAKWSECPGESVKVVKTTAAKATTDCVRDTLKRAVLPDGTGPARLTLDVTLSSLEPSD